MANKSQNFRQTKKKTVRCSFTFIQNLCVNSEIAQAEAYFINARVCVHIHVCAFIFNDTPVVKFHMAFPELPWEHRICFCKVVKKPTGKSLQKPLI